MSSDFDIEKWANDEEAKRAFQSNVAGSLRVQSPWVHSSYIGDLYAHAKLLQLEAQLQAEREAGRKVCEAYQKSRPGTVPRGVRMAIVELHNALPQDKGEGDAK